MPRLVVALTALLLGACGALPSIPFMGEEKEPETTMWICVSPPCRYPTTYRLLMLTRWCRFRHQYDAKCLPLPDRLPLPDALYAADNRDEVRMQRLGDRNWLRS